MFLLAVEPHRSSLRRPSFLATLAALPLFAFVLFTPTTSHAQSARPAIHKVPPIYPQIAKQAGITGTVVVMATVDPSGKVIKAEVTSGNKMLGTAAIDSVKQWKFAPGSGTDLLVVSVDFAKQD